MSTVPKKAARKRKEREIIRGLVNKNGTSLKYDSEALNEVLFSKL